MNARQKAKKYKRELEMLKKQTIRPMYIEREPRAIDTFVSKQIFSVFIPEDDRKRILIKELANDKRFFDSVKLETPLDEWIVREPDMVANYIRVDVVRR